MSEERIEAAVERIERALSRISAIAEEGPAQPATAPAPAADENGSSAQSVNVSQFIVRHEELRETVAAEIERLDALIGKLQS